MELFIKDKRIRLKSHRNKYLTASEDQESTVIDHDGTTQNSIWTVEYVQGNFKCYVRLRSCYGTYLAASNVPFLPGFTGKKVVQTNLSNHTTEWEPVRDGMQARLKSHCGDFLRPNGGLPPWRNSVTHDIPHRNTTLYKMLWDIESVEDNHIPKKVSMTLEIAMGLKRRTGGKHLRDSRRERLRNSPKVSLPEVSKKKIPDRNLRDCFGECDDAEIWSKDVATNEKPI